MAGKTRIVCFGDSITGDRPGKIYHDKFIKWSDWLQFGLEQHLGEGNVEVINSGFGGDATYPRGEAPGGLARVEPDILRLKPGIAVILFGVNNFADRKGVPLDEVKAEIFKDMTTMVRQVKDAGIKVLLLQYHMPRDTEGNTGWGNVGPVNDVIAEVAEAEGVELAALEPAFAEAQKTWPVNTLFWPGDFHLNTYGEVVVARVVMKKILEMMKDEQALGGPFCERRKHRIFE